MVLALEFITKNGQPEINFEAILNDATPRAVDERIAVIEKMIEEIRPTTLDSKPIPGYMSVEQCDLLFAEINQLPDEPAVIVAREMINSGLGVPAASQGWQAFVTNFARVLL